MVAEPDGERDRFGRPIAWSSITPPRGGMASPASPRTPRSPVADDDDDRRADRAERRQNRQQEREGRNTGPTEPVGLDFRLRACETTLRDHTNELAAQKLMLQQLVEAVKSDNQEKKKMEERLDNAFAQVHQKVADVEKPQELTKQRVDMVMQTVNSLASTIAARLDEITHDLSKWKHDMAQQGASPTTAPPAPVHVPPTPNSWAQGSTPSEAFGQRHAPTTGPATGNAPTSFGTSQNPNAYGPNDNQFSMPGNGSGPTYHDLRSPGSPLNPQQPRSDDWHRTTHNAQFGQWAPGAGTEMKAFDTRDWSVDGKKPSKELRSFDGNISNYDNWRRRMRDHFISTNCNYATISGWLRLIRHV